MSLFGSFADVLAKFSPRRPHHRRHPSLSQHSDTLPSPPRSQSVTPNISQSINRKQGGFSLGLNEDDDDTLEELRERPIVNVTSEPNVQSEKNLLSPNCPVVMPSPSGPANRPSLMDRALSRPGQSPQMLSGEQKRIDSDRQDEARLLGVRNVNDDHAVKITPGGLFPKNKKSPGSSVAFKPTDTFNRNVRQSGPVPAQGKSKKPKSYVGNNLQRLGDVFDGHEDPVRPRKRRRHDDPGNSNIRTESASDRLSRMPPGSSQYYSSKPKSSDRLSRHTEYRGVEENIRVASPRRSRHRRFSDNSEDETFTAQAARQRRSLVSDNQSPESPNRARSPLDMIPVQVPGDKDTAKQVLSLPAQTIGPRWISKPRESPDELQGEATTQPIPKNLCDKPKQNRQKHQVHETLMSPSRKRSPADIQPTDFAGSPRQGPKRMRRTAKSSSGFNLELMSFRFGPVATKVQAGESATVDLREDGLEVGEDIAGPRKSIKIFLRDVVLVIRGREPSMKIRLKLAKKSGAIGGMVDIELLTIASKTRLVKTLQDKEIKIQYKDESYMDKAFANHERELIEHGSSPKRPFLDCAEGGELVPETKLAPQPAIHSSTRQKISSALQGSCGEPTQIIPKTQDNTENSNNAGGSQPHNDFSSDHRPDSETSTELPVKSHQDPTSTERETRARTRQTTRESDRPSNRNERSPGHSHILSPENDAAREKWKKPLVYPQAGKKRAEVNVEDRDRLREGEFLNDNLIGLYMRFLQDHLERTNPKAAKRVYFFNSYFFDTLINTPKGDRGINYGGVEKWTRSVDLFSYDYIVVPINQNAHWFVALICNLPSLCSEAADDVKPSPADNSQKLQREPEGEVYYIADSPEPEHCSTTPVSRMNPDANQERVSESPESHVARQSLACMSLEGQQAPDEIEKQSGSADEWPDREENQASPPAKFSPPIETPNKPVISSQAARKPKKKTRTGPKLDPRQTTIVTFDSLGHSRSPTIRILKDYIFKEAASKRGVDVEPTDIKGMCARQIPLQPNFSDCGLYLLAYLEKFVQDPDPFTRKLLRREMDEHTDWPPLGSGLLRHRLRNFLDELYGEQIRSKIKKNQTPIMADQQPVSFLLGPPLPSQDTEDHAEAAPALTEEAQSVEPPKTKRGSEESVVNESPLEETSSSSDDDDDDIPQLVPTGLVDVASNAKGPPNPTPTGADPGVPRLPIETEVMEVPDSQEPIPDIAQASGSGHAEKKKSEKIEDSTTSRKYERKKITMPIDAGVATVSKPRPDKPHNALKVEVQIRQTPPPTDQPVRKSPRENRKT